MRSLLFTWLFLMQFVAVFFEVDVVLVSGQCQTDQLGLLLQLKNRLNFSSTLSVKLVKWNQGPDCCSWDGVRCDTGGYVTSLDLSNEGISNGIDNSSSLFHLQHLQSLNLAYNRFSSVFPSGFDKLANLRNLNLSNAGFTGQIPLEISRMTRLVTLDLSVSVLLGSSLKLENPNLGMLIQNLKELKYLYLDGVNISAQGKEWCQALSSSLPKLQVLSMSSCYLSGPIDSSFSKLRKISREILQVLTLKTLDLSYNPSLEGYFKEFPAASSLETLVLSDTSFGGNLPESIGNLGRLTRIELAGCNFNGSIPNTIANLTQLISVDLSSNCFSGPIPSFSSAKNLRELNLAHNQLTGSILSTNWSLLSKLVSIDLRNNSLNGTLPPSLFGMPSLQRIHLLQNHFTGGLNKPSELAASLLNTLDLGDNKLAGPFPLFTFQLRSLKILVLSSNNFSGQVNLSSFQQLMNLSSLDLSYNSFLINASGIDAAMLPQFGTLKLASCKVRVFPDFLFEQSVIRYLDLSANQIDGEIPRWIWNIGSLTYLNLSHNFLVNLHEPLRGLSSAQYLLVLDLHSNRLQGQLPSFPPSATYLDYSSNNFCSVIPVNFGDYLSTAQFISLSNNHLHGSIPKSICNATQLSVLDLSNNLLNGTFPQCLTGMESLRVLNLGGNILNGIISDAFSSNCSARTVDLNGNHLEGKIPRSLANCTVLEVLDFGNNRISYIFPCHLENVSSLRVLVLRSNNLHGQIGCPVENYQIVLKTWKAMVDGETELRQLRFEVMPLSSFYYQDAITVTMKGLELQLVKILNVFTSVDFSGNNRQGTVPEVMGELRALYFLNLSHNALTGPIPSSLGNLRQLESLDLSSNNLTGEIPQHLSNLNFLSVLNLSNNQLIGEIPTSNQFQTFSNDSFYGNKGLCGFPLKKNVEAVATPQTTIRIIEPISTGISQAPNWDLFLAWQLLFFHSCSGRDGGFGITIVLMVFSSSFFLS
ncbi:hypothetical protein SLEP1_g53599 [Rubroshorea leprosula]|uniref:Leucine-rich repeat-containing N-terminal plant-type domain-containing protein n=1 Tax=Rubroshorea leprosula TaxID=152421 RepID=A0AAV5MA20_9ROSI|nr:hypothetical protein SLEP1_g53599 [Rubroshorea leprosula]